MSISLVFVLRELSDLVDLGEDCNSDDKVQQSYMNEGSEGRANLVHREATIPRESGKLAEILRL